MNIRSRVSLAIAWPISWPSTWAISSSVRRDENRGPPAYNGTRASGAPPGAPSGAYGVTLMPFGPSPTRTLATTFAAFTSRTDTEFS